MASIGRRGQYLGTESVPKLLLGEGLACREGGRCLVHDVGDLHLGAIHLYHCY